MEFGNKISAAAEKGRCAVEIKRTLAEALLVAVAGAGIGLLANFASPRGLALTRDYFPAAQPVSGMAGAKPVANADGTAPQPVSSSPPLAGTGAALLRAKGLQAVSLAETEKLFREAQQEPEATVFVDARDDRHFQDGHIPGAYQFDRYYPEKHLPVVLPICLQAAKVIVYCAGGMCEDSEFASLFLIEAGVPRDRIYVFAEGMTGWTAKDLPVEAGARDTGRPRTTPP